MAKITPKETLMKLSKIAALVAAATTLMASTVHAAGALDGASLAWSSKHTGSTELAGFTSEVVSFDSLTKTLWVAGVTGVHVLDAKTGTALKFIDTRSFGSINSIAIHNGVAAFAIEAPTDRRNAGVVKLYDTGTRDLLAGTNSITVGALPDMLTFTPNGGKLLVANEGTPNAVADANYTTPDPKGSVSIIDMNSRSVAATVHFDSVTATASNRVWQGQSVVRQPGMDFEPEYIAVSRDGSKAFVTLQEHNAVATIDLATNKTVSVVGLGAKDFNQQGNEIDTRNGGGNSFKSVALRGLYMPDGIASFDRNGKTYYVIANEGDLREDNVDRANAKDFGAAGDLADLRVSKPDSSKDALYSFGARSISIRDANGDEVWDSGAALDKAADAAGLYADSRSPEKGVEPEDVKVLEIGGRLFAFVGLERTSTGAIGVFDISDPANASFVKLLVNPTGFNRPEGLTAYEMDGHYYLAVASEGSNSSTFGTTVFQLAPVPEPGTWALMGLGLAALGAAARRQRRG